jgi:hypothetical protein
VYAPVVISASGDAKLVALAPASTDIYGGRGAELSWQPVLP